MKKINKYIIYKDRYYYLRYIKNNRIIIKTISFLGLYEEIKKKKINTDLIIFNVTFTDLFRDYVKFEDDRI